MLIKAMDEIVTPLLHLLFQPFVFIPLVYPGLIVVFSILLFIIWLERKVAGKVQLRYGPLYVCKRFGGVLQLLADLLRYLFAEVIVPEEVDKLMFILAPILLFASTLLPIAAIPVSPNYAAISNELSLLISLALVTIPPIFVLTMSWASSNKFSFIGGLREGYLMVSYEVSLLLSALSMAVLFASLNFLDIVEKQTRLWGIALNPLAAIVFFLSILVSTSKFPFEIAEADTEIVCGPYTEYSGIIYGLSMGYGYVKTYVLSLMFTLLFLGGWNPIVWPPGLSPTLAGYSLPSDIFFPSFMVLAKTLIVMAFSVFLRAVYPRYRIDQAIKIGWHVLFTLSILSIILSISIVMVGGWK